MASSSHLSVQQACDLLSEIGNEFEEAMPQLHDCLQESQTSIIDLKRELGELKTEKKALESKLNEANKALRHNKQLYERAAESVKTFESERNEAEKQAQLAQAAKGKALADLATHAELKDKHHKAEQKVTLLEAEVTDLKSSRDAIKQLLFSDNASAGDSVSHSRNHHEGPAAAGSESSRSIHSKSGLTRNVKESGIGGTSRTPAPVFDAPPPFTPVRNSLPHRPTMLGPDAHSASLGLIDELPRKETIPEGKIPVNPKGYRLDAYVDPPSDADWERFHDLKHRQPLCNYHHIGGQCPKGDACEFDHAQVPTGIVDILTVLCYRRPCARGPSCRELGCMHGHVCANKKCKVRGGQFDCDFPPGHHRVDLKASDFVSPSPARSINESHTVPRDHTGGSSGTKRSRGDDASDPLLRAPKEPRYGRRLANGLGSRGEC